MKKETQDKSHNIRVIKLKSCNQKKMYAIVDIAGQQFKVEKDQKHFVHRLNESEGEIVDFNKVLLIDNDGKINIGAPVIEGARVSAKILQHVKGEKVFIFKKNRRKGYQKLNGHRQQFSEIIIESIEEKATPRAPKAKKETATKVETASPAKPKVEKKAAVKTEAKKTSAKKASSEKTETTKKSGKKKE